MIYMDIGLKELLHEFMVPLSKGQPGGGTFPFSCEDKLTQYLQRFCEHSLGCPDFIFIALNSRAELLNVQSAKMFY